MFSETEFKSLLPPTSLQMEQFSSRQVGTHPCLHKIYCKHHVLKWGFALPFNQDYQTYVQYIWLCIYIERELQMVLYNTGRRTLFCKWFAIKIKITFSQEFELALRRTDNVWKTVTVLHKCHFKRNSIPKPTEADSETLVTNFSGIKQEFLIWELCLHITTEIQQHLMGCKQNSKRP